MNALRIVITTISIVALAACSTQNREATPQVEFDELTEVYSEIASNTSDSVVKVLDLNTVDTGRTFLYHAREAEGRPADTVLALKDMNAVDNAWDIGVNSIETGLETVDVIFVDTVNENDEKVYSLMIKGTYVDGSTFYFSGSSLPNDFIFTENTFETEIEGPGGQRLVLRSNDLSEKYNDELADSVELKVYIEDNGQLYYAGYIATMAGFGVRN